MDRRVLSSLVAFDLWCLGAERNENWALLGRVGDKTRRGDTMAFGAGLTWNERVVQVKGRVSKGTTSMNGSGCSRLLLLLVFKPTLICLIPSLMSKPLSKAYFIRVRYF